MEGGNTIIMGGGELFSNSLHKGFDDKKTENLPTSRIICVFYQAFKCGASYSNFAGKIIFVVYTALSQALLLSTVR